MSVWGRVVSAWNGARTGWTAYSARGLYPRMEWGWNDYRTRLGRYSVFQAYRDNSIYSNLETFSAVLKVDERLYKYTRGIYNPIKRENDLYASNVYQGSLNTADLGAGALPLEFDNTGMEVPLQQLEKWSNLGQQLSRYVSEAALYGDAAWWIVDDPSKRRVRLELLDPSKIRDADTDEVGNVTAAVIEYEREENPDVERYQPSRFIGGVNVQQQKTYVYTLKATKRDVDTVHFETFKDGEPFGFYEDENEVLIAEWDAPYSFVPLKLAAFEPTEDGWGKNSFYASRGKIDDLNSVASQLNASIKRVIEPILMAKNVTTATNAAGQKKIDFSTQRDDSTGVSVLFISGEGADMQPLTIPLDLAAASAHVQEMLAEIERDMPVLALQRIRENGNLTAPGVRSGYSDAIGRIESARKNLDPPLVAALQMAITIGGVRGYDGFDGFTADSYDAGDMELRIKERAVMPDELSSAERLTAYGTVKDLPPALQKRALLDMGVPKKEVDEIVADAAAQQQAQTRAAVRGMADSLFNQQNGAAPNADTAQGTPSSVKPVGTPIPVPAN